MEFGGVNGHVWEGSKVAFWGEMGTVLGQWNISWVQGGGFNTIKLLKERVRHRVVPREIKEFSEH